MWVAVVEGQQAMPLEKSNVPQDRLWEGQGIVLVTITLRHLTNYVFNGYWLLEIFRLKR